MKRITAKVGNMRKAVDWTICPVSNQPTRIYIQSDRRIAVFDPETGEGRLSKSCTNPGFAHLNHYLGATDIQVPQEVIDACVNNQPKSGDEIGPGVYVQYMPRFA